MFLKGDSQKIMVIPKNKNLKIILILFCSLSLLVSSLPAAKAYPQKKDVCILKTCFEQTRVINGRNLFLGGVAFFRRAFIHAYQVALYVPRGIRNERQVLSKDVPKTVVVEYDRDVDVRDLFKEIQENLPASQANDEALKNQFIEIAAAVYPIRSGERHEFVYEPGKGTTLFENGESRLKIPGDRFAHTFFSFWLARHNNGNQLLRPGTLPL